MQQPLITEIETVHATAITEIDIVHAVAITNAGLVLERLRVRIPAGAAGECSSPESTLCADSYSVSVPPPCYRSGTLKTPIILPKVQVAGYT